MGLILCGEHVYSINFTVIIITQPCSLLVAIGLEAFNKFTQEQKEKLETEKHSHKEDKKPKLTGRYLLKGVVDMLADTFATTNEWVCFR